MISRNKVLPNFLKSALVVAAAATSISVMAGDGHKSDKAIGELKDMKKSEKSLKKDEMVQSLSDDGKALKTDNMSDKKKMSDKVEALKAEGPDG